VEVIGDVRRLFRQPVFTIRKRHAGPGQQPEVEEVFVLVPAVYAKGDEVSTSIASIGVKCSPQLGQRT
jgi:hypothetical protein